MPRKIPLISSAALALAAVIIAVIAAAVPKTSAESTFPETVSVYLRERGKIVSMPYAEFAEGCLCGIIPDGELYEPQTLEALAVVVNTNALYALRNRDKFGSLGADLTDSGDLPYVSYAEKAVNHADRAKIRAAVANAGQTYLAADGNPFRAEICYISTGRTDPAPFSPSAALPCDALAKGYLSKNAYSESEIIDKFFRVENPPEPPEKWFKNAVYNDTGTLRSIEIDGVTLTGEQLRSRLGLRSAAIGIDYSGEYFYITCKGLGNNVGMSLSAADSFARDGKTAEEILGVFYQAELV